MRGKGMTDRVLGAALAALGAAAIWGAQSLQVLFLGDPVGPKVFPTAAGVVLLACGCVVALRPGAPVDWPTPARLSMIALAAGALAAYALLMRPLGFVPATALAVFVSAAVFGARLWAAGLLGLGAGSALFLLFDRVLEIPLPLGVLAGVFG